MRFATLLLPLALLLTSCTKKSSSGKADKIVFGTFYGMCAGNCVRIYQVDATTLQKDDSVKYPDGAWTYNFNGTTMLSADKFNIAKDLLNQVPSELLNNNNKMYGAPDSHDQGGVYIQIIKGTEKRRFRIDFDNSSDQSAELITFKNKVADIVNKLK